MKSMFQIFRKTTINLLFLYEVTGNPPFPPPELVHTAPRLRTTTPGRARRRRLVAATRRRPSGLEDPGRV